MKTKEELNALKNEVKNLSAKLAELSEDELIEVTGGAWLNPPPDPTKLGEWEDEIQYNVKVHGQTRPG